MNAGTFAGLYSEINTTRGLDVQLHPPANGDKHPNHSLVGAAYR